MNYARRQQYRRLSHAGKASLGSVIVGLFGLVIASAGATALGGLLLLTAVGLGLYARHWLSLASRSRVGARSEDEVQRALAPLQADGWQLRHSLRWQGRGDIDSVAIAPNGVAVVIETKTMTYERRHLALLHDQTAWLARRRRRWARRGALGVMCLVRARGAERVEHDVLVVSVDRLIHVLRVAAGMPPGAPSSGWPGLRRSVIARVRADFALPPANPHRGRRKPAAGHGAQPDDRDVGGWSGRREAPGSARTCRLVPVSSRPPSIRACGSPAHGSPTFFTVGIRLPDATAG